MLSSWVCPSGWSTYIYTHTHLRYTNTHASTLHPYTRTYMHASTHTYHYWRTFWKFPDHLCYRSFQLAITLYGSNYVRIYSNVVIDQNCFPWPLMHLIHWVNYLDQVDLFLKSLSSPNINAFLFVKSNHCLTYLGNSLTHNILKALISDSNVMISQYD